jgi:hypothetical protein
VILDNDVAYGLEQPTVEGLLTEWNYAACEPPLEERDIERISRSAATSRQNPIGIRSPDYAPDFEVVDIEERAVPTAPVQTNSTLTLNAWFAGPNGFGRSHVQETLIRARAPWWLVAPPRWRRARRDRRCARRRALWHLDWPALPARGTSAFHALGKRIPTQ